MATFECDRWQSWRWAVWDVLLESQDENTKRRHQKKPQVKNGYHQENRKQYWLFQTRLKDGSETPSVCCYSWTRRMEHGAEEDIEKDGWHHRERQWSKRHDVGRATTSGTRKKHKEDHTDDVRACYCIVKAMYKIVIIYSDNKVIILYSLVIA